MLRDVGLFGGWYVGVFVLVGGGCIWFWFVWFV